MVSLRLSKNTFSGLVIKTCRPAASTTTPSSPFGMPRPYRRALASGLALGGSDARSEVGVIGAA